ncbi:hypothetical protein H7J87_25975 [Mycolicibacterium wolinskyi]|uniref:Fluoride ion transporter CrcB n=1 Tax=Mycolicibacterium wolinskyi TaxID=59750 RepID=A0A1X2F0J9_9MYCO|nr:MULTISPECIES: hypothetical protein [Mycolicibacterium]MCV7288782.1 hypothetical protein [Mycolicibacterium wolinskyi]MCV7296004.1 hypothetical protein [Mycolicibacterium goodii]ORX11970.1 hypothetical protein AWC31_35665 [Mycolicibacterium wolinskyi]
MAGFRRGSNDVTALIVGGGVGAAVRFQVHELWPTPLALVTATVGCILAGCGVLGYALASTVGGVVRAFLAGVAGGLASISGYIAIGVSEAPWPVVALIVVAPAAVIAGLWAGASLGVALRARRREPVGER